MAKFPLDEDGELEEDALNAVHTKMVAGEVVTGEEAWAWIADEFAGETHGNYCGGTLYRRADLGERYIVTVQRRPPEATP